MSMKEIVPTCLDKFRQPIVVGDIIVYGHALGRCAALKIGKVLDIRTAPSWRTGTEGLDWRISVQGVDDGGTYARSPAKLGKKGTLMFPDRMLVVGHEAADLPWSAAKYRDLLGGSNGKNIQG